MALPFALGVVAIVLAMSGRRLVAIWAWAATVIVLLAWLGYHSTNVLAISLQAAVVLIRLLNLIGLLGISLVLLAAFYYQLALGELPCPLCLLQRGCFIALGIGFVLNVRFGSSPIHYAMILASALLGAGTALRQVFLHIAPGDPGYGSSFLGIHMYSWSFIAFTASILYVALMLALEARSETSVEEVGGADAAGRLLLWLFLLVVVGNFGSTLLECGFGACPDNPTGYQWLLAPP